MESILTSVKKMLGLSEDDGSFDMDIIMHINTVFTILTQLGVGPNEGFSISDASTTWDEYLPGDVRLNGVKSYMYAKVRMLFDPPQNGAVAEALNRNIAELEWRMNVVVDPGGMV